VSAGKEQDAGSEASQIERYADGVEGNKSDGLIDIPTFSSTSWSARQCSMCEFYIGTIKESNTSSNMNLALKALDRWE